MLLRHRDPEEGGEELREKECSTGSRSMSVGSLSMKVRRTQRCPSKSQLQLPHLRWDPVRRRSPVRLVRCQSKYPHLRRKDSSIMKYRNGDDVLAQRNSPNMAMHSTMIGIVGSGVLRTSSGGDIGPPEPGEPPLPPGDPLPSGSSILFLPPDDIGFSSDLLPNLGCFVPCAPNEILPGTPLPTWRCLAPHRPPAPGVGVFCPSASSSSLSSALSFPLRYGEEGRAIRFGASGRRRAGEGTLSTESSLLRERIPPRRPVRAPVLREGVRRLKEMGAADEVEAAGSSGREESLGRRRGGGWRGSNAVRTWWEAGEEDGRGITPAGGGRTRGGALLVFFR